MKLYAIRIGGLLDYKLSDTLDLSRNAHAIYKSEEEWSGPKLALGQHVEVSIVSTEEYERLLKLEASLSNAAQFLTGDCPTCYSHRTVPVQNVNNQKRCLHCNAVFDIP